jgi:hypothetical protein
MRILFVLGVAAFMAAFYLLMAAAYGLGYTINL